MIKVIHLNKSITRPQLTRFERPGLGSEVASTVKAQSRGITCGRWQEIENFLLLQLVAEVLLEWALIKPVLGGEEIFDTQDVSTGHDVLLLNIAAGQTTYIFHHNSIHPSLTELSESVRIRKTLFRPEHDVRSKV